LKRYSLLWTFRVEYDTIHAQIKATINGIIIGSRWG